MCNLPAQLGRHWGIVDLYCAENAAISDGCGAAEPKVVMIKTERAGSPCHIALTYPNPRIST